MSSRFTGLRTIFELAPGAPETPTSRVTALFALGIVSVLPYLAAVQISALRLEIVDFELAFFAAFALYAIAVLLVLRDSENARPWVLASIFGFAVLYRALFLFTTPSLTDDMYRYVWDGRVQAHGFNPYQYPPDAPELSGLRDTAVWPFINRMNVVTVYPAGAQLAFATLWRVWPDNVQWFQAAMAGGDLLAGALLMVLLRSVGQPPQRSLILLWSPLAIVETAHAAHVDGLVLPLLVGALIARSRGHDVLTGLLLGAATSMKLYTVLLLPALWRVRDNPARRRSLVVMPLSLALVVAASYAPYWELGVGVAGFLPTYFTERFNPSFARLITDTGLFDSSQPERLANGFMLLVLALIGLAFSVHPARTNLAAIQRCIWIIGAFALLTQILYPWYLLWLLPFISIFLQPGHAGFKLDGWTGWFLFTGLVMLSYTWFISSSGSAWTFLAQFGPLVLLLLCSLFARPCGNLSRQTNDPKGGVLTACVG